MIFPPWEGVQSGVMLRRIMSTDDVKLWRKPSKSSIARSKSVVKWNSAGHDGGGHLWFSKGTGYVKTVTCISAWKNLFSTLCNFVANHTTIQRSICKLCVFKNSLVQMYIELCLYIVDIFCSCRLK